jgi:diguanylate cyclase (GGDEF)-like protein
MALSQLEEKMLEQLIAVAENLSLGRYSDNEKLIYSMTDGEQYPPVITRLAEAFGMMAVKIGAREYHLEQIIQDLTRTKDELTIAHERLSLDGLTRIPNRWALSIFLEDEWKRAVRTRYPVAMIMIDIDFFKTYNDIHGHPKGDDCLCRVAEALKASCRRPTDLLARYGGEEFIAVLPNNTLQHAAAMAEFMRSAVASLAIPHDERSWKEVSISLGVAVMQPTPEDTPEQLVNAADRALYDAKRQGRNRVACHVTEEKASKE